LGAYDGHLDINSIADSVRYGILSEHGNTNIIWIKLKGISLAGDDTGSFSPLTKAAIQFLRLNLPSKAYPGYETDDDLDFSDAVKLIGVLGSNIFNAFTSFDKLARENKWAIQIDTTRTLARLDNPFYKKYGGGLRVKSIKIYDNWKKMSDSMNQAVYGQTYDYTALCRSFLGIKTDSSSLIPAFKPTQGNRMIFSAWVEEKKDCNCQNYDSNAVSFTFHRSGHSDTTLSFKPTGNIIEGWQRYDTVVNIPSDADSMRLSLKSTGHSPVYFDDVRMLPYNANMKSFVYDPISLRLMAELDENNYATFYEYDDDGTLIRVKKETERGIQTIKETRSNLSKLNDQ
jgi:hypothetical protein